MEINNYWWGYLHTSGTYHPKRYFGALDTDEARESPFCDIVIGPFLATGRDDAMEKLKIEISQIKGRYHNIKTEDNYRKLLNSGMFWEIYPELSGDWSKDKTQIL